MTKPAIVINPFLTKKGLFFLIVVIILFASGLLFSNELHISGQHWAEYLIFIPAYLLSGWVVLNKAVKNIIKGKIFDENFLMTIATFGAIAIHEMAEAVAVMMFYNLGEFIQGIAVRKSRRSIKDLLEIRPDYANLLVNGNSVRVSPDELSLNDMVIVKPGEKIPVDGIVVEGNSFVDTYPLTGESVPRKISKGDIALAGAINKNKMITLQVKKLFAESTAAKILDLAENAAKKKAKTEKFITSFARVYTPIVVCAAVLIAVIPPLFFRAETFEDWIYRSLVILVISCPCALVVSIPLGYFGGIGGASKKGILVKGSDFLDALTMVKTVVFDKTGTLTKGVFKVQEIRVSGDLKKEDVLKYAAFAEFHSNHPIAKSILEAWEYPINESEISRFEEISGQGVRAFYNNNTEIIAGNDRLLHYENIPHKECISEGTVVHVAINKRYLGFIIIADELKTDSINTIRELKELGISKCIMLTGDNDFSAAMFAKKLSLDKYYAGLLPEDKVALIEKIIAEHKHGKVAFVGDGINDAPVIMRSDVGIAMGALGSDAAVEAADIVIMTDHPSKVPEAIRIAKSTRRIVWQNITFALGIKIFFIALGGIGLASMWEAVFADMGVAILAILNSSRMLKKD